MAMLAITVLLALILDRVLGEPKRYHPLVGFGILASGYEKKYNSLEAHPLSQFTRGILGWLLLVIPLTLLIVTTISYAQQIVANLWLLEAVILYWAIGYTSLKQHALAVFTPLTSDDLLQARQQVAAIVSRDTEHLDMVGVCRATIESVLENGSDAVFAPLFWYLVAGIPGVIVYRLANTLDAMWGYKTNRFVYFGRFAARMDDILNWFPSRLVALSYALVGNVKKAFNCWVQQASTLASPNGGVVMTSGAGALNRVLGGDTFYQGEKINKPLFGCGEPPAATDIKRALSLVDKTLVLWCLVIVGISLGQWFHG